MTGHEYRFSLYEPVEADIVMTNKRPGKKSKAVELSEEEAVQYRRLKNDEERKGIEAALAPKYARQLLAKAERSTS